jgi:hypothetical protein
MISELNVRGIGVLVAGALLIPVAWAQAPGGAAPPGVVRPAGKLALHEPVERELGPGQTDVFTVGVAAGQFMHVAVEKKGVDVAVELTDSDDKVLVKADSPNGAFGPDPASLIADGEGQYQIRVARASRNAETGGYRIQLRTCMLPRNRIRRDFGQRRNSTLRRKMSGHKTRGGASKPSMDISERQRFGMRCTTMRRRRCACTELDA